MGAQRQLKAGDKIKLDGIFRKNKNGEVKSNG